ncbi:tetratricopeptide repeat-containing response regulator [Thalassotalea profundi]|uniref:Response regulator n=1 Tax=Thalassotalea profundi TaxID=2036687 RepID=A0ABQ3J7H8_9GAMM|nr:tetratricopeptide repeat-containing response regulator [Thalassotalea profundi]GHF02865.1 response regulator [Thalassotalea profundi]
MAELDYENKRFLIIDSIKQSRDMLKIFCYSLGAKKVDTSHRSTDILSQCAEVNYNVILLGYDLGDNKKNGQQLLEELRAKNLISRQCIVIMITAEVSQSMVLAALEHKPDEYLTKPYTMKDLSTRLSRCFDKKIAMHAIYHAMDVKDHRMVIHLCDRAIKNDTLYKHECLGIKSRQYFDLKQYDKAKRIYHAYLGSVNCQWAALGLGKIALIEQNYALAEKYFTAIIEDNQYYLSAYDWLAKTYQLTNQLEKAENVLESALLVSPRSVSRLKEYAQLCFDNNQFGKATKALSKTNELAYHSVHKNPDNALQFVDSLLEHAEELGVGQIRRLNVKAFDILTKTVRDFNSQEIKIITLFLTARLHNKANEVSLARASLNDAERLLERYKTNLTANGTFNIAKSLIALNRRKKAEILLDELSQANPDNMEILSQVVALSDKPISEQDKIAAQTALEIGVSLYRAEHYVLAIDKLNQALTHFPNHIGIKLNLLQVLLVSFEKNQKRVEDFKQASVLIKQFKSLTPDSESYLRFLKLKSKYESLRTFHI